MGVCLVIYGIEDRTLNAIIDEPALVWKLVEPGMEGDRAYENGLGLRSRPTLWSALFGRPRTKRPPRELLLTPDEKRSVDLEKSWDGLNACLSACCPDTTRLFAGDRIASIEVGCGPPLFHDARTTGAIAEAYLAVSEANLLHALSEVDFSGVYLQSVWEARDDEAREYVLQNFRELRGFLEHVHSHGLATLLTFT